MVSDVAWRVQRFFHGQDSWLLPCLLVMSACGLIAYRHLYEEGQHDVQDPIKAFLILILGQMLPLVVLEMKILSCPDPVSVLTQFGVKVLLMFVCFLGLRVICPWVADVQTSYFNYLSLAGAFVALSLGFGLQKCVLDMWEHRDVCGLMLVCLWAATGTGAYASYITGVPLNDQGQYVLDTASNYIELLAFAPAVWMITRSEKNVVKMEVDYSKLGKPAVSFVTFLVLFYVVEDLGNAIKFRSVMPLAAAGHIVHFLLLADFAGFILARIYSPEKLKGQILSWLPH